MHSIGYLKSILQYIKKQFGTFSYTNYSYKIIINVYI